jgi:hypothetical protein
LVVAPQSAIVAPEPAAWTLVLLGLAGILVMKARAGTR